MLATLNEKIEDLFDGDKSMEMICESQNVDPSVYSLFVDRMGMKESHHTYKSKMFI